MIKTLVLAAFALASLATPGAASTASNSSLFATDNISVHQGRSLTAMSVESICNTKDGKPLRGRKQLFGEAFQMGSIFARCDKTNKPTCYVDDGIIDRKAQKQKIGCADALKLAAASNKKRRLGTYRRGVPGWPKGVVCYNLHAPTGPRVQADFANQRENVERMIKDVMTLYSAKTKKGIQFMAIKDCVNPEYCDGCKHFVNFEFELDEEFDDDDMDCWSYVGYLPGLNRELKEVERLVAPELPEDSWFMKLIKRMTIGTSDGTTKTYQPLNLSPQCWDTSTIAHEIGHTLGLLHDHQRADRGIILKHQLAVDANDDAQFEITPNQCGLYDMKSVMHYDDDFMCRPRDGLNPAHFCDVAEEEGAPREGRAEGCIAGVPEKHCHADQSVLARPATYLPVSGDYTRVMAMYAREQPLCTIQ